MANVTIQSSVVIDKTFLERALNSLSFVFKKAITHTSLYIKIVARDNKIILIADDGSVLIRSSALTENIENLDEWKVDGVILNKFIKTMNRGLITLESDGQTLYVKQGKAKMKIPLVDEERDMLDHDYAIGMIKIPHIDTIRFLKGIKQTGHSSSTLVHHSSLQGIHIVTTTNGYQLVATDTKRMSFFDATKENDSKEPVYQFTISKNICDEITRIFERDTELYVGINDIDGSDPHVHTVGIIGEDVEFYTSTVVGEFAEFRQIINRTGKNSVFVNKLIFLNKIKQVATCSEHSVMQINKENIILTSLNGRVGSEIQVELESDNNISEDSMAIGLNNKYIIDSLNALGSDFIKIEFDSNTTPIIIHESGEEEHKNLLSEFIVPYQIPETKKEGDQTPSESKEEYNDEEDDEN